MSAPERVPLSPPKAGGGWPKAGWGVSDDPARRASALAAFAVVSVLGYALHRAWFSIGEPDPRAIGPSIHTPYFWRVATVTWWGAIAAAGAWRFPSVGPFFERVLPWAVGLAVVIAVFIP